LIFNWRGAGQLYTGVYYNVKLQKHARYCEITKILVPKKVISHLQSGLHLSNLFSFPFILLFCSDNDINLSHSTAPNPLQSKMQGT